MVVILLAFTDSGGSLKPKAVETTEDDWEELEGEDMSEDIDTEQESETVWVYTLQYPDGSGDGTVPDSSATALDVAVTGWDSDDDCEDVDAFGESTGQSEFKPESTTIKIGDSEESKFDRGHEPIYKSSTGQSITFSAIENLCLLKIEEYTD